MPEGDTIYRSARTLKAALAGRVITGFRTVLPHLARVNVDTPLSGRTVDDVVSRGKHILMFFSGDLILRTHMRMHGAWHLYRPGERWKQPGRDMRIVIGTDAFEAVAFRVPVAEFRTAATLERDDVIQSLGPDLLDDNPDLGEAVARLRALGAEPLGDALLNQRAVAGIGNVFKSEICFAARVSPFGAWVRSTRQGCGPCWRSRSNSSAPTCRTPVPPRWRCGPDGGGPPAACIRRRHCGCMAARERRAGDARRRSRWSNRGRMRA